MTFHRRAAAVVAVLLWVAVSLTAATASAVPPFARRYQVACNTCHTVPPQLNAFGEAFRMNGYQWPEEGDENGKIKDHPVILAADANREAFPDAFLPSDIPHLPAVGFQAKFTSLYNLPNPDGNVTWNGAALGQPAPRGQPYDSRGQLDWSGMNEAFNIFVAGRIATNVTFFGGVGFYSPQMNFAVERAMIYWSNVFGPNWFNVKIGRFDPDVSFFTGFRKLVNDNYSIMSRSIGQPSGWALEPPVQQPGIEVNGKILGRVRYNVAALTNYTGLPGSLGGNGAGIQNDSLDAYVHLTTKLGGLRLDGVQPREVTSVQDPWVDDALWLGVMAFRGQHDVDLAKAYAGFGSGGVVDQTDTFYRVGVDAKLTIGSLWVIGALAVERHTLSAASGGAAPIPTNHVDGDFVQLEAQYIVYPWLIPNVTFDYYHGTNPLLVNAGWGAVGNGVGSATFTAPLGPGQTPATIDDYTIRPALLVAPLMNWRSYLYAELGRFPLKADAQSGTFRFSSLVLGSQIDF